MMFQSHALFPHPTVGDNIGFGLQLRMEDRAAIARRVAEVAETLRPTPLLARSPRELSGGQRQRVAIGRAIIRNPKVVLFGEPLSSRDAALRVQMRPEIPRLHQRQGTETYACVRAGALRSDLRPRLSGETGLRAGSRVAPKIDRSRAKRFGADGRVVWEGRSGRPDPAWPCGLPPGCVPAVLPPAGFRTRRDAVTGRGVVEPQRSERSATSPADAARAVRRGDPDSNG